MVNLISSLIGAGGAVLAALIAVGRVGGGKRAPEPPHREDVETGPSATSKPGQ